MWLRGKPGPITQTFVHCPPLSWDYPSPGLSLQPCDSLQNFCSAHTAAAEYMEKPRPGGGGCHTPSPSKSPQLPPLESQRAKESRLAHLFGSYLPNFILPELRSNLRLTVILSVGAGGECWPRGQLWGYPPSILGEREGPEEACSLIHSRPMATRPCIGDEISDTHPAQKYPQLRPGKQCEISDFRGWPRCLAPGAGIGRPSGLDSSLLPSPAGPLFYRTRALGGMRTQAGR